MKGKKTHHDQRLQKLRYDVNIVKEQLGAIHNVYESKLERISLTTYRCFARQHQIMLAVVPRVPMTEAEHNDNLQLLHELFRNIQQMRIPYDHSTSTDI